MNSDSISGVIPRKDGRKVLMAFLAFFVVFASVDAFFVYKAISTLPGVVSENAYEIGLNYNKIIAEAKKRKLEENEHSISGSHRSKSAP
jgi:nitrogen fixation protein FixH